MKRTLLYIIAFVLTIAAEAQTLNVKVGNVTYLFPAAQTGEMTYADGTTVTIMGKTFTLSDISSMTVDDTEVTDGAIAVDYSGTSATVTIAGNIAQYVTPTMSGAHVSIAQSDNLAGTGLVVSGASQPTLMSGVTVSGGTTIFDGVGSVSPTVSGGSSVSLSSYTGGGGGPGGGGPGGGWR